MKTLILLLLFISNVYAGTCTGISRTNYTSNQVLTASSLNTQLNAVFGAANALDGGCIVDSSLEIAAFSSSDFEVPLRAIQQGCKVSYTSANVLSISKCYSSVNGAWLGKSTATSVTMGCSNCSADSVSTAYYVYIATGSSGTTLTPLILTGAPNDDGYDASGNKVLARFYNNASAAIDQYSIDQWVVNRFVPTNTTNISYTPVGTWVSNATYTGKFRREGGFMVLGISITTSGAPTSTSLEVDVPTGFIINGSLLVDTTNTAVGVGSVFDSGTGAFPAIVLYLDTNTVAPQVFGASSTYATQLSVNQTVPMTWTNNDRIIFDAKVPIIGWND